MSRVGWLTGVRARFDRSSLLLVVVTVGLVLAMLVPLALWGTFVRETLAADTAQREADQRSTVALLAASSIDREILGIETTLKLFAAGPAFQVSVRDRDGEELDRRLGELLQGRSNSLGAVLDANGIVLAAPLARELVGQDFSHRDYFSAAILLDGPYVSEVFASATVGSPSVVAISTAVRDSQHQILGVLVLTLAPADLIVILEPLRQVRGRELVVADARGLVVAATDPGLRPLDEIALPSVNLVLSRRPIQFAGSSRIVSAAPIPSADWVLYVSDDPAVVLAAQRRLEEQLILGGVGAGLVALIAAAGIAWLYTTSLRQRASIAQREAALQQANAGLAAASRHKSEFLAGMSHELRTPLNAILGFSELLEEQLRSVLTDRQRRYMRNVRDAGQHLLGLINDVLDLSKVEAGRVELRPETTTLEVLIDPIVSSTRAAAEMAGLRFRVEADRRLELFTDVGRVRQILYNLLSNAVKFTPRDGEVALRAGRSGHELRIEVRDTGIGIPADKRDQVFGTFERLHEGRFEATGTGLGLALTKSLVELHGGTITFESVEGHGTTFRVRLPDIVSDATVADRILVVEDERRDAELVVALAAEAGLAADVAPSVEDAIASLSRSRPSAVVLDLRLLKGRGETVLEHLRANEATRDVPVLVVTVEDDDGNSRALGADGHLTKPIDRARLTAWLRSVAARSKERGDRATAAR